MKRFGLWVAAALAFGSSSAQAGTVTLSFGLDDLLYNTVATRVEKFGGAEDVTSPDRGVVNFIDSLAGFDEATHGTLERVTVSLDYALSGAVFARYGGVENLADPDARVEAAFLLEQDIFVFGIPPGEPGRVLSRDSTFEAYSVSTEGCAIAGGFCTTRDAITIDRPGPITRTFVGDDLDAFRGFHRFGLIFDAEVTSFSSTVDDRYAAGLFTDSPTSPFFASRATYSITYETTAPIPLPASAAMLLAGIAGLMSLHRRRSLNHIN